MSEIKSKSQNLPIKLSYSADGKKSKKMKKSAQEKVDFSEEYKNDPKYKTELCKTFAETSLCIYGNKCRFAHGKDELFEKSVNHPKYKQKECLSFFQNSYCIYGPRCHFKHEEKKFKDTKRSYFTYMLDLIELNINETIKKNNFKFFDEDDQLFNINNFNSANSSPIVSKIAKSGNLIFKEMIENKINQKINRLSVFSTIFEAQKEFDCKKCLNMNYQKI